MRSQLVSPKSSPLANWSLSLSCYSRVRRFVVWPHEEGEPRMSGTPSPEVFVAASQPEVDAGKQPSKTSKGKEQAPAKNESTPGSSSGSPSKRWSPAGLARRFSSRPTPSTRADAAPRILQQDISHYRGLDRWKAAVRRVLAAQRFETEQFKKARRNNTIWKEDPPGGYAFKISHTAGLKVDNPALANMIANHKGTEFEVQHLPAEQHTFHWKRTIVDPAGNELPPGTANLFTFPMVMFDASAHHLDDTDNYIEVVGDTLDELKWLIHQAAAEPQRVFYRHDASGACPLHALLISNSATALELAIELFRKWPRLITLPHGPGIFVGETVFHALAANRREHEFCEILRIAQLMLSDKQYAGVLNQQTNEGAFFQSAPQSYYGSTATSFATSFGMMRAVAAIMEFEFQKVNHANRLTDKGYACKSTGFLPLHCAVANGKIHMFDFLSGAHNHLAPRIGEVRLPNSQLTSMSILTADSKFETFCGLTPLQLAAKIGDNRMCKHILRKRLKVNWQWGPLTSYKMPLDEVDSAHGALLRTCDKRVSTDERNV